MRHLQASGSRGQGGSLDFGFRGAFCTGKRSAQTVAAITGNRHCGHLADTQHGRQATAQGTFLATHFVTDLVIMGGVFMVLHWYYRLQDFLVFFFFLTHSSLILRPCQSCELFFFYLLAVSLGSYRRCFFYCIGSPPSES